MQGWLTKVIGKVRLLVVLEILSIITAILYSIQSLTFLMILRVITGMLAGLSIGLVPVVAVDLFPPARASLGSSIGYLSIVVFILLASLQDIFYGGIKGL